jgi:hypothetical protein
MQPACPAHYIGTTGHGSNPTTSCASRNRTARQKSTSSRTQSPSADRASWNSRLLRKRPDGRLLRFTFRMTRPIRPRPCNLEAPESAAPSSFQTLPGRLPRTRRGFSTRRAFRLHWPAKTGILAPCRWQRTMRSLRFCEGRWTRQMGREDKSRGCGDWTV